ncbi:hypothetical protein OHC33_003110 [Knufia fluminis]|uniref:Box C/D snoRNA protein 1 n=1 Tax=Knufia fluminis TaxID=191047 RepID=A0AAN8I5H1_9EURO|nr:hypothetical protein OHC33_003110 [Knufia fluminis]
MSHEILLTDLCAICHVNAIKYTCPRCGIHTCSLPCVKKHKTWAQCSGIRNPAEYRKRAELATPSSIDKDFNFITNVERAITKADDDVLSRDIGLAPVRQLRRVDARPKVEMEIEQRGVKVVKAPKRLSRAKQNKTHWVGQQKSVMWTVEWICSDGERITGSALESRTLGEAYINIVGKKKIKRKRRLSTHDQAGPQPQPKVAKQEADGVLQTKPTKENEARKELTTSSSADEQLLNGMHFYLHNPQTSSKFKCLIPLPTGNTIRAALEGQTVLEYPTVYVKNESPEELKDPFISQDEYQKRHGDDIPINLAPPLEDGEIEDPTESSLPVDVIPEKVLEVLAQDLAA